MLTDHSITSTASSEHIHSKYASHPQLNKFCTADIATHDFLPLPSPLFPLLCQFPFTLHYSAQSIFPRVPLHPIFCKERFDDLPEIRPSDGFKSGPVGVPERKKSWLQKREPQDIHLQRKGSRRAAARRWSPLRQKETLQNKPSLMTPRS